MPAGRWSGGDVDEEWDGPSRRSNISPEAFMEELTSSAGGYGRFFKSLMLLYLGWWAAVVVVPTIFLDHHKCEADLSFFAWLLYGACVLGMVVMAVLLELSVVQNLGLLKAGEFSTMFSDKRWQVPLVATVLWKLDSYTDVAFMFVARDCGSSLWWASFATFIFGVVFGQLLPNTCFAWSDCAGELPRSFGFVLLDFKLVNTAIRDVLPFDPDASDLPVPKAVTLRTTGHLVGMEKVVGDIAQVSIQLAFLHNTNSPQTFIIFSVLIGMVHGTLAFIQVIRECVQDEWDLQSRGVQLGTALMPAAQSMPAHGSFSNAPLTLDSSSKNSSSSSLGSSPSESKRLNSPHSPDHSSSQHSSDHSGNQRSGSRANQIGKPMTAMTEIPDLL